MHLIIAGSRLLDDPLYLEVLDEHVGSFPDRPVAILSGCCRGVDRLGERWARSAGVPVLSFPAEWQRFGRSAGPRRNGAMVAAADALLVLRLPSSRGSRDVLRRARAAGLVVRDVCLPESRRSSAPPAP